MNYINASKLQEALLKLFFLLSFWKYVKYLVLRTEARYLNCVFLKGNSNLTAKQDSFKVRTFFAKVK